MATAFVHTWRNALDPHAGSPPHDEQDLGTLERLGDSFAIGEVLTGWMIRWGWRVSAHTFFAGTGWRAIATHPELGRVEETGDSFATVAGLVFCEVTRRRHRQLQRAAA